VYLLVTGVFVMAAGKLISCSTGGRRDWQCYIYLQYLRPKHLGWETGADNVQLTMFPVLG